MNIPSQLEMARPHLRDLPPLSLAGGSGLRTYTPGDEEHWTRIVNSAGWTDWTVTQCLERLVRKPEFRADGCFLATVNGLPQGTATAWRKPPEERETGYVHMVAVAPEHRGRGLGRLVTLATLHWFQEHGFSRAILHTDDWRLPAIRVYFQLGFEPVLFNEEHARRWQDVRAKLAEWEAARQGPGNQGRG